jgi:hypothetical protein
MADCRRLTVNSAAMLTVSVEEYDVAGVFALFGQRTA